MAQSGGMDLKREHDLKYTSKSEEVCTSFDGLILDHPYVVIHDLY